MTRPRNEDRQGGDARATVLRRVFLGANSLESKPGNRFGPRLPSERVRLQRRYSSAVNVEDHANAFLIVDVGKKPLPQPKRNAIREDARRRGVAQLCDKTTTGFQPVLNGQGINV